MRTRIPINWKYVDDPFLSWEDRYRRLEARHYQETHFLIDQIKKLEEQVQYLEETKVQLLAPFQKE